MIKRGWQWVIGGLSAGLFLMPSGCGLKDPPISDGPVDAPVRKDEISHEKPSECDDGDDNDDDGFVDCDDLDCRAESDACELAPPLDRTVATTIAEVAAFIDSGPDPIQKDLDRDELDPKRLALIHGRLLDETDKPLRDVRISIKDHPEFGYTLSRGDGRYDLLVNGGGALVFEYQKQGYLSTQRTWATEWQHQHRVADVGLVELSARLSPVKLGERQIASSAASDDSFGSRHISALFAPGTRAAAVSAEGQRSELSEFGLRITEYPFEVPKRDAWRPDQSLRRSPGSLPLSNAATYSMAFRVEEAEKLDAVRVEFDRPVVVYVDDFLDLPPGAAVPLSFYDPKQSHWQRESVGVVLRVLEGSRGRAQVDVDGDGEPEDAEKLEELGITDDELAQLHLRNSVGQRVWRLEVKHFSDYSVVFPTAGGGEAPNASLVSPRRVDRPMRRGNVLIEPLAVHESVPIVGSPVSLEYQTDRTLGYGAGFEFAIQVLGDEVPADLEAIQVISFVGGREEREALEPSPNLEYRFRWDGRDAFGRLMQGEQEVDIAIGYLFTGSGLQTLDFDDLSNGPTVPAVTPQLAEQANWRQLEAKVGVWDTKGFQIGGFGLSALHAYDPGQHILYFGNGTQRRADDTALLAREVRDEELLERPDSVAVDAQGRLVFSDDGAGLVYRLDRDGDVKVVLGEGAAGAAGAVELVSPQGIAVDPTSGDVFVVDAGTLRVYRVSEDGQTELLMADDESATIEWELLYPDGIALGTLGQIYLADFDRVFEISGTALRIVAGGGDDAEASSADELLLEETSGIAVEPTTGDLIVASRQGHRVYRITPGGRVSIVAGTGSAGFSGDGAPAIQAQLDNPRGVAVGEDHSIYIADQENHRIRRVFPDGRITTVIGGGTTEFIGETIPATQAKIQRPDGLAFGANGSLYIASSETNEDGAVSEPARLIEAFDARRDVFGDEEIILPSNDGSLAYVFDLRGKHLRTQAALTGFDALRMDYDDAGFVERVVDVSAPTSRSTTFERSDTGLVERIVAPHGHVTEAGHDGLGALSQLVDPLRRVTHFEYTRAEDGQEGLLELSRQGPGTADNQDAPLEQHFDYDAAGRVIKVVDPTGYEETFEQVSTASEQVVTATSPSGAVTSYLSRIVPGESASVEVTGPEGNTASSETQLGAWQGKLPNGTQLEFDLTSDPRWGEQVRYPDVVTVVTPSGRRLVVESQLGVTSLDTDDPTNVTGMTRASWLGDRESLVDFDRESLTLVETSPEGRRMTTRLDADTGLPARREVDGLASVEYERDDFGRVVRSTRRSGANVRETVFRYDDQGPVGGIIDALGRETAFAYDAASRARGRTGPDQETTQWRLGSDDRVLGLTPPGRDEHVFQYEGGLLAGYYPPAQSVEGSPKGGLDVGQTDFSYDEERRPERVEFSDGRSIALSYTNGGRLTTLSIERGKYDYSYNSAGQVTAIAGPDANLALEHDGPLWLGTTWSGGVTGSVHAEYDEAWQLSALITNGERTEFSYDRDGLLLRAGELELLRDPATGFVTKTTLGGADSAYTYNPFAEIVELQTTVDSEALFSQSLERDDLGRVTRIVEQVQGEERIHEYQYDDAGRLRHALVGGLESEYEYDPNGNRTSELRDGESLRGAYDEQDRILAFGEWEYFATEAGDVYRRSNGVDTYDFSYDEVGALTNVDLPTGQSLKYSSDGLGRRVGRALDGTRTHTWLYKDRLNPVAEIDGSGALTEFVYGHLPHVPAYMIKAGRTYRLVVDHLGSVRLVVDSQTGEVAQALSYDAYGRVLEDTNPGFQPFGFAGGLYDPATSLVRFGSRDYDAETGRWLAKDHLGFAGRDGNIYVYAGGDPVNVVDPEGHLPLVVIAAVSLGSGAITSVIKYLSDDDDDLLSALAWGTGAAVTSAIALPVGAAYGLGAIAFTEAATGTLLASSIGMITTNSLNLVTHPEANAECLLPSPVDLALMPVSAATQGVIGSRMISPLLRPGLTSQAGESWAKEAVATALEEWSAQVLADDAIGRVATEVAGYNYYRKPAHCPN